MAVYTITLSDTEGGVVSSACKARSCTTPKHRELAYALMEALVHWPGTRQAERAGNAVSCACDECLARRARGEEPHRKSTTPGQEPHRPLSETAPAWPGRSAGRGGPVLMSSHP